MADSLIAGGAARRATWLLAGAAMVLVLLAPAIWNGFPIIFPDTGGYLIAAMTGTPMLGRSALYGLFLSAGIPFAFWPCVILQCALVAWLFVVTLRVNGLGGRPWLALAIVALTTVTTSLPWFAGQLMPDILFAAAVLALYLLAFAQNHPADDRLARWERYALAAVIAVAVPSHMAAAALCVAVIAALWLLSFIKQLSLPTPRLSFAAAAVIAGIALSLVSNLALIGKFGFTPGGSSFLFGRLLEDGIIEQYLEDKCPDPSLRICAYQDEIPELADDWLWGEGTAFYKLGSWDGFAEEQGRIIRDTLWLYPLEHLTTAIVATLGQLISFETEVSIHDNEPTFRTFADLVPDLVPALMSARQQHGQPDVVPLNKYLYVPVGALAIGGLVVALIFRRRLALTPETAALCFTILLVLVANAAICGIFSHPVDRYQSRLVLLAPFVVAILAAQRWRPPVKA
ncbi:MAG: hypothetical protein Q8M24_24315 [Pseudolabrys sp.]|nr:hypothetical protein [Pseudolabrys sp.]MDP2298572.1 hypothetical protein [Pseudolabrys sp.]